VIEQNIAGYPDQIRRTYEPGSEEYESVYNRFLPLIPTEQEGGKVEKARNGKRVNNKTRTITEVGNGLNKYDAEDLGIDPNTLVDTSSIITAYPNGKPYVVNGQLPF
jgi:hypothetical protein